MSERPTIQTIQTVKCPQMEVLARAGSESIGAAADRLEESAKWLEAVKWMVSFPAMLGTFLAGRVFYEARGFFVDPDVWWHIRIGQDILRTHHWPTTGPYSFTAPNMPWIAYEWLGDVILAKVAGFGGNMGLFVLLTVCASAAMLGLYYYGRCDRGIARRGLFRRG